MAERNSYQIRRSKAGTAKNPYWAYSMTMPASMAEAIGERDKRRFRWEWHEDGFLVREIKPATEEVPGWAR